MLLPLINNEGSPLRAPFKIIAAITAATLLTIALPTLAQNEADTTKQDEGTSENPDENPDENTGDQYDVSFYSGTSEMLPTEYYQHSAKFGPALYRRYIEQIRDKQTKSILSKETGKIIQEYYVSHEMLRTVAPSLNDPAKPVGIQNLGIAAVKLWLKRAHEGTPEHNACLFKPNSGMQPEELLEEGAIPQKTRSWVRRVTESDDDLLKCGLSLRLVADFSRPATLQLSSQDEREVFMYGKLCRYPYGRNTFNATQDDAECQDITKISLTPDDILLLSGEHEQKRTEAAILRAEKDLGSAENWVNRGPVEPQPVGVVVEMFGQFLTALNVIKYGSSESHLNPSYVRRVSDAGYEEKVVRQDYTRFKLKAYLDNLGIPFAKALEQGTTGNLKAAGVDLSVGEFYLLNRAGKPITPEHPTFVMKIEKDKGITFEDLVNGETITLLNREHMEAYVKDATELAAFRTKYEVTVTSLRECQAEATLCEKGLEEVAVLMIENKDLRERLKEKDENTKKEFQRLQALLDTTDNASAKSARMDQKALDDAILEQERQKQKDKLSQLEADYTTEKTNLTNEHDVRVVSFRGEISQLQDTIRELESKNTGNKSEVELLRSQIQNLRAEVERESDRYDDMLSKKESTYKKTITRLEDQVEALEAFKKDSMKQAREHDTASNYQMNKQRATYEAQLRLLERKLADMKAFAKQGMMGQLKEPKTKIPELKVRIETHSNGTSMFYDDTNYPSAARKDEL